ncbi:MAG: tryptophan synthase subunit beta [Candidatus Roizmanbacteria bacterium]
MKKQTKHFFDFKTKYDADEHGHFGKYGGRYAPEMLIPALEELEKAYNYIKRDSKFEKEFLYLVQNYSGRPTPLFFAENLTKKLGGAKIYLKNEGLNITGAHKITHCIGQALICKYMGKKKLVAETGAGQHGLASATIASRFGFECTVYMGEEDVKRQRPNVFWMEQLGATVVPVKDGTKTLKDAVNASIKHWITNVQDTHYILGSCLGPHPFPSMNRDFQQIVGYEVKEQIMEQEGKLPDYLIACTGGGSNAMGLFYRFLEDENVQLIGVEAGGRGIKKRGEHAVRFKGGKIGVVEGYKSLFLQDDDGNISHTHSISAGLDYPGIGPQLAYLGEIGRVQFSYATDDVVIDAFKILMQTEGIIPALESAHAVAEVIKLAPTLPNDKVIVVNISGRGDKDIFIIAEALQDKGWKEFIKQKSKEYEDK